MLSCLHRAPLGRLLSLALPSLVCGPSCYSLHIVHRLSRCFDFRRFARRSHPLDASACAPGVFPPDVSDFATLYDARLSGYFATMDATVSPPRPLDPLSVECVLQHSCLTTLRSLAATDHFWRDEILQFLSRKFNSKLRPYIDNIPAFCRVMRSTDTLLGGIEALDFALHGTTLPTLFAPSMELYVGCFQALAVVMHLRDVEGYYVAPIGGMFVNPLIEHQPDGLLDVITLAHPSKAMRIDVMCSTHVDPRYAIVHAPTTLEICYVTPDCVVVGYPDSALHGSGQGNPLRHDPRDVECRVLYFCSRGFRVEGLDIDPVCPHLSDIRVGWPWLTTVR